MNRMLFYEFLKQWKNRLLLFVLLFVCALNAVLTYFVPRGALPEEYQKHGEVYEQMCADFQTLPPADALDEINHRLEEINVYLNIQAIATLDQQDEDLLEVMQQIVDQNPEAAQRYAQYGYVGYSQSMEVDAYFLSILSDQLHHITEYDGRIASIEIQEQEMLQNPLFASNPFALRNIEKTAQDYVKLKGLPLKLDTPWGLECLNHVFFTDLFALFLMIFFISCLVGNEKSSDILSLLRTMKKGRQQLMAVKLITLFSLCLLTCLLLYGSDLFILHQQFGFGDLSRPIQSDLLFGDCSALLTVGSFLAGFVLQKLLVLLSFSLLVFIISLAVRNYQMLYLCSGALLAVEFLLYQLLASQSSLYYLKYLNLFCFLDAVGMHRNYVNLNLFGYPVSLLQSAAICTLLLIVLFVALLLTLVRIPRFFGAYQPFRRIKKREFGVQSTCLFYQEFYKLFVVHRSCLVLLLLLVLCGLSIQNSSFALAREEQIYHQYLQAYQGPVDSDLEAIIEQEHLRFEQERQHYEELSAAYQQGDIPEGTYTAYSMKYKTTQDYQQVFQRIEARFNELKQIKEEKGLPVYLLDDTGFSFLLGAGDSFHQDLLNASIAIAILCALLPCVFTFERGRRVCDLISSCKLGHTNVVRAKLLNSFLLLVLVFFIIQLTQWLQYSHQFSFWGWEAPIQSLPLFSQFPLRWSILQFFALASCCKLLALVGVVSLLLLLSVFIRHTVYAILISEILFAAPILLYLLGIQPMQYFAMLPMLSGNLALYQLGLGFWLQLALLVIGSGCFLAMLSKLSLASESHAFFKRRNREPSR